MTDHTQAMADLQKQYEAAAERMTYHAIRGALQWLTEHNLTEIEVQDDAGNHPSYACPPDNLGFDTFDVEMEPMDEFVSWLPAHAFANSTPNEGWNPVLRVSDLRNLIEDSERQAKAATK